jgi:hypothetical protein
MIATLNTVEEKGGHVLLIFSYITLWVERRPPPPLSMSISCDRAARGGNYSMASKWPVVDEHSIKKKLLKETHKTADRDVINEIHQTDARQQERRDSGLNGRYSIDIPFWGCCCCRAVVCGLEISIQQ